MRGRFQRSLSPARAANYTQDFALPATAAAEAMGFGIDSHELRRDCPP